MRGAPRGGGKFLSPMDTARLDQLLADYFDRDLGPTDQLELEHLLLEHREARRIFWQRASWDATLSEWGEEHWGSEGLQLLPSVRRTRTRWALTALAAAACVAFALWLRPEPVAKTPAPVTTEVATNGTAILRYAAAPKWDQPGPAPAPGDILPEGSVKLLAGLATFELPSGAQVSVQGPAQWRVTGPNSVHFDFGRATAQVPEKARGFRIETPSGVIVDYGTVFGFEVKPDGATEAHVITGKVEVGSSAAGAIPRPVVAGAAVRLGPADPAVRDTNFRADAFPSPYRSLGEQLRGGSFESGARLTRGGLPRIPGEWRGDMSAMVAPTAGVTPRDGAKMLRFLRPEDGRAPKPNLYSSSDVWQMIDVRSLRQLNQVKGPLLVEARAFFNTGKTGAAEMRYTIRLVAWHGSAQSASYAWKNTLAAPEAVVATATNEFSADADPTTWEPLRTDLSLSEEVDWLLIGLSTHHAGPPDPRQRFDASFVDDASVQIAIPPQISASPSS